MHAQTLLVLLAATLVAAVPKQFHENAGPREGIMARANHGCAVGGLVNGQCASVFSQDNCGTELEHINPDCSGQCHVVANGFRSIKATGNGFSGTDCQYFSDNNCQNSLGDTGNVIFGGGNCITPGDRTVLAHSYRCFFAC